MREFLGGAVWPKISATARKSKRNFVAVAYVGAGATKLLPLKKGDLLVANVSLAAVKQGQTDPREIKKYIAKGVEVHSCSNLHAKVFALGNTIVVGSSNISRNSDKHLNEAIVFSKERPLLSWVRGYIKSLATQSLTIKLVDKLIGEYRPPRWLPGESAVSNIVGHESLWVLRVVPAEYEPQEERISAANIKRLSERISRRSFEINSLRWDKKSGFAKRAEIGHRVIQVWKDGDDVTIFPPAEILGKEPIPNANRIFAFLCESKNPRTYTPASFAKLLKKGSVGRLLENLRGEIKNPSVRHKLLGLWPSVHK
jgi:hypothetical protein